MSLSDIQKEIVAFRDERDWKQFHAPENLAKSVVIESAELLECFQWNGDYDVKNVSDEIADVFIYLMLLCDGVNIDVLDAVESKLALNREKYPVAVAKGSSKKYTEL